MGHIPDIISIVGFFSTLALSHLIGIIFNVDWLTLSFFYDVSKGFVFEADISWIPIILAVLVSYLSWNLASSKFANE